MNIIELEHECFLIKVKINSNYGQNITITEFMQLMDRRIYLMNCIKKEKLRIIREEKLKRILK